MDRQHTVWDLLRLDPRGRKGISADLGLLDYGACQRVQGGIIEKLAKPRRDDVREIRRCQVLQSCKGDGTDQDFLSGSGRVCRRIDLHLGRARAGLTGVG